MARNTINEITIRAKLAKELSKTRYQNFAYNAAKTRFVFAKQQMLKEFDEHAVTKELINKPETSELLDREHPGSLFAFIGFYAGENPTNEVRDFLSEHSLLIRENPKITVTKNSITYNFKVRVPSKTQMFEQFPSPDGWTSMGWLELIEKGTSTAASFIFAVKDKDVKKFEKYSRSGRGLQNTNYSGGGVFLPRKYISEIIDNFLKNFE